MTTRRTIWFSLLGLAVLSGPGAAGVDAQQRTIAIIHRLFDDQEAVHQAAAGGQSVAQQLDPLFSNDEIITSPNTRAAVRFTDDGSVLRVSANSSAVIRAETQGGSILRTISLEFGELYANVQTSPTGQPNFQVQTPSGVAAVKGTEFIVRYDPTTETTTVITLEGLLDFFTGAGTVEVPAGFLASAVTNNVAPSLQQASDEEIQQFDAITSDPDSSSAGPSVTIEIPGVDDQGRPTTIVLTVPESELGALLGGGE